MLELYHRILWEILREKLRIHWIVAWIGQYLEIFAPFTNSLHNTGCYITDQILPSLGIRTTLLTKLYTPLDSTVNSTLHRIISSEHYTLPVNPTQSGRVYRLGMNLENSSSRKFFQSTWLTADCKENINHFASQLFKEQASVTITPWNGFAHRR